MALAQVEDTGNGATLTLSTTSFAVKLKKINGIEIKIDKLEVSNLSTTTWKKFMPSDLKDTPELSFEFYWDTGKQIPSIGSTSETLTVTFPLRSGAGGEGTAANLAGTGFFTSVKFPDLANGETQMGSATFAFDGGTGPAFTIAVAA